MPPLPSRLLIASQLQAALQVELEHVIEIERLLGDAHYARDVLLVCDALRSADLSALAAQFRAVSAGPVPGDGLAQGLRPETDRAAALRRLRLGLPPTTR